MGDYKQVQQSLESCQQEIARLKAERNLYEENMKKAFMRGVCALNMEALTMFQHPENESADEQCDQEHTDNGAPGESQSSSTVPRAHIHPGSEAGLGPSFSHPNVPKTQFSVTASQSQTRYSSKSVRLTAASAVPRAGPSSSQSGASVASKVGQSSSSKRNVHRFAPAVVVEKH